MASSKRPSKTPRGATRRHGADGGAATRDPAAAWTAKDEAAAKKPAAAKKSSVRKKPVQAGARKQPQNPMPKQHLRKPGNEHELEPAPRFLAPDYKGSGKLDGMVAIITGGDSGIGRAVAVLFAREGADVAILYLNEHEDARDTKMHVEKEGRRCITIAGDVRGSAFCERAVRKTVKAFGQPRHPGQQRRVPAAQREARRPHRRAPAGNAADQHRRLLPHGARGAAAPASAARRSSTPARRPGCSAASTCSTTRRPRARSMPSRCRWRATCSSAASASTRSRRGRCGRR